MTTKITVNTLAGWPVQVSLVPKNLILGDNIIIVKPNEVRDFYIHSGLDLVISEIQPEPLKPID
jgi:hypothetical protein